MIMKSKLLLLALAGVVSLNLSQAAEVVQSTHVYKSVNGLDIKAEVYSYPDERERAAVVWLHGGALINGGRQGISGRVRKFAMENGYVLVSFDYRLAPETQLPGIVEDLEDAFRWLRKEGVKKFRINPARIAVTGGSAGGYMTLTSGFRVKPTPTVLLSFWGYGDLVGDWYSKPSPHPRHNRVQISASEAFAQVKGPPIANSRDRKGNGSLFYLHCRQTGTWPKAVSGWSPQAQAQKFYPFMAAKNVTSTYPPTALIHGTEDTDVPFRQSEMMAEEFSKHGVKYLFLPIKGGEHGLAGGDRGEIDSAYQKAFEFVRAQLEK
jgi:acetyl esterase/lipase